MSKIDCYDLDGVKHVKQPIDAKECVDTLGWSLEKPIVEVEKPKQTRKPRSPNKPKVTEDES